MRWSQSTTAVAPGGADSGLSAPMRRMLRAAVGRMLHEQAVPGAAGRGAGGGTDKFTGDEPKGGT